MKYATGKRGEIFLCKIFKKNYFINYDINGGVITFSGVDGAKPGVSGTGLR